MTDSNDVEPDPAALDELLRAFADDEPEAPSEPIAIRPLEPDDAPSDDDASDTGDGYDADAAGDSDDDTGEPAEILIVEQDPLAESVPEPAIETPAPRIIRIDDYSGSVAIDDAAHTRSAQADEPARPSVDAPVPTRDETGVGAPPKPGPVTGDPVVIPIGGEDDLPDPVYVEGNLERSGNRTIVFIEDDDTGDTVIPAADRDARRGIEPRLRERRAAVKRALGRKRLRWVIAGLVVVLVAVAALAVFGSGLFSIKADNVEVTGAVYTDAAQLDEIIDDLIGTPVLLADTQEAERRIEAIPWVDSVKVDSIFPDSLTIDIRERQAIATYQGPDLRFRVLDRDGRVLEVLDGDPIAYMRIDGPDPVDLQAGDFAPQGYAAASDLAKNLTPSIRERTEFLTVTADGSSLSLTLDDGTEVRFGAARELQIKLIRLETALRAHPDREPGPIDVSTNEVTL